MRRKSHFETGTEFASCRPVSISHLCETDLAELSKSVERFRLTSAFYSIGKAGQQHNMKFFIFLSGLDYFQKI